MPQYPLSKQRIRKILLRILFFVCLVSLIALCLWGGIIENKRREERESISKDVLATAGVILIEPTDTLYPTYTPTVIVTPNPNFVQKESIFSVSTEVWLNRIGLILNFLAFWFSVPELIGEKRLIAWERKIESSIERSIESVKIAIFIIGWILFLTYSIWNLVKNWQNLVSLGIIGLIAMFLARASNELIALIATILGAVMDIYERLIRGVLKYLADDETVRRRYLWLGALLFVLGTILQFIATF